MLAEKVRCEFESLDSVVVVESAYLASVDARGVKALLTGRELK